MADTDPVKTLQGEIALLKEQLGDVQSGAGSVASFTPGGSHGNAAPDYCDIGSDTALRYDYMIVGQKKVVKPAGARTSFFLRVPHDGSLTTWVLAMPATQDTDATVFDIRCNRIYLPGEIVG